MEVSRKEYMELVNAIDMLLKDSLANHRFTKEVYLERKAMLESITRRKIRLEGTEENEESRQSSLDTFNKRLSNVLSLPGDKQG